MNFDELAEPLITELDNRSISPEVLALLTKIDLEYVNDVLFNGTLMSDVLMESLEALGIRTYEFWQRHQHSFLETHRVRYTKEQKETWFERIIKMKFDQSLCSDHVASVFSTEKKSSPKWREYMFGQRSEFEACQMVMRRIASTNGLTPMHYDALCLLARTDFFEDYAGWHIQSLREQLDAISFYRAQFARYVMIREAIIH